MDLSGVVLSLASGTYTVTRRTVADPPYDADGIATAISTTTLSATGSIQPASGRDLKRLPEGRRTSESRVFFTPTELRSVASGQEADLISADGDTWEVSNIEPWPALGNYYRAIITKVGR
jgi:hypothetical protein